MKVQLQGYAALLRQYARALSGVIRSGFGCNRSAQNSKLLPLSERSFMDLVGSSNLGDGGASILLPIPTLKSVRARSTAGALERFSPTERFVIAHELGHLILLRNSGGRPADKSEYWQLEQVCNDFARRLLISDDVVLERILDRKGSAESYLSMCAELSSDARAPWAAAAHRISDIKAEVGFFRFDPEECGFKIGVTTVPNSDQTGWLGIRQRIKLGDPLHAFLLEIQRRGGKMVKIPTHHLQGIARLSEVTDCAGYLDKDGILAAVLSAQ